MTTFLCTAGTSAAKNLRDEDGKPLLTASWVEAEGGTAAAARRIWQTFADFGMDDDAALQRLLSAEIHSLARMHVTADDRIILFSSETPDGQASAEAVRLYLVDRLPGIDCRVESVNGLQVRDAKAFRTRGVLDFTRRILRYITDYGAENCILNPTGGFKSLVPYTVLIGMLKGVEARYIFEQSREIISLPQFPLEFARERLEPWRMLLERVERESYISEKEWREAVPYRERTVLQALFEVEDGQVTLSPVGLLIFDEIREPHALTPFVSRPAVDDLLNLQKIEGCKPLEFLQRVAQSPAQLENSTHEPLSNGLFWLKPGAHTRDRYLVSVEAWRLLVWRMTDHDEYEELLLQARRADLGARLAADRRNRYEPFFRLDMYSSGD